MEHFNLFEFEHLCSRWLVILKLIPPPIEALENKQSSETLITSIINKLSYRIAESGFLLAMGSIFN